MKKYFWNYCKYESPSLLSKDLIKFRDNQAKREQLVNNMNDGLIDLSNAIDKKTQLKTQIKKTILLKKSWNLINNKNVDKLKYYLLKQKLLALALLKTGHISENLLNEIRQIIYSFYQAQKFLKKYITI